MLVSAFQLKNSWPWGGTAFELRWFYNRTWTDIDGTVHLAGQVGPNTPCLRCPGTIAGETATVLSFEHPSTKDSPDRPNVRADGALFDENNIYRATPFQRWQFPVGISPITEKYLTVYNSGIIKRLAAKFLDADQIMALFGDFVGAVLPASDVVLGSVITDSAPADAVAPRVVGVKESGIATLAAGEPITIVPNDPSLVAGNSPILAVSASDTVLGNLYAFNRVAGASFDIASAEGADAGDFKWYLF